MKTPLSIVLAALTAGSLSWLDLRAAETNALAAATNEIALTSTNAPAEVHVTPQDLEKLRREMESAAARHAQMLSGAIEPMLNRQHQRELEILQSANRTIFIGAGIFAGAGLLGFLVVAWMLVRALGRFSEMAAQQGETVRALGMGRVPAALGPGETAPSAEQSSARFMGAIERLEKRIHELEATTPGTLLESDAGAPSAKLHAPSEAMNAPGSNGRLAAQPEAGDTGASHLALLLGKGQALLNLDQAQAALAVFDEALTIEPDHADALVKKGLALDKLQRQEKAMTCFDRAIALNDSLTVAWLHKGGLCNRLERHAEALECYEQAIRREPSPTA